MISTYIYTHTGGFVPTERPRARAPRYDFAETAPAGIAAASGSDSHTRGQALAHVPDEVDDPR